MHFVNMNCEYIGGNLFRFPYIPELGQSDLKVATTCHCPINNGTRMASFAKDKLRFAKEFRD